MGILDRRVLRATVVAASLLGACYEFVGPVPAPTPELLLTGAWAYELTGVPGGGFADSISMVAVGGRVSGAGREYSFGRVYPFTIAGSYSDTTWFFNLTFSFEIGLTDIYTGRVYGADSLYGGIASSPSWDSAPQVFYRQPVPPCTNPAIRFPPPVRPDSDRPVPRQRGCSCTGCIARRPVRLRCQ